MTRRGTTGLASAAAVLALATGCGTGTEPTSAPATTKATDRQEPTGSSSQPAPSEAPTSDPTDDGPPFPESTDAQTEDPRGDWDLVLTDVRTGSHDGYDRLVMEFEGTGTPGWSVQYADEPRQEGSGERIDLAGDVYLDVFAAGTTYPAEGAPQYDGPRQFQPGTGTVADVYVGGTFEGYTQVLLGLDGERTPVRVFTLEEPARLVVDVSR